MSTNLSRALACSICGAEPGEKCRRLDGQPRSKSHSNRTPVHPCGSIGGYQRHVKAGEAPCDQCREANRRYMADYRRKRPEVRERDIAALDRRREAVRLLIQRHEAEFRSLLAVLAAEECAS